MQLYIYNCGDLYPIDEASFSFKTWEVSLLAKTMILKFSLQSDVPYSLSLPLMLDLLYSKKSLSSECNENSDFWQQASPINRCWHTWNSHVEMN